MPDLVDGIFNERETNFVGKDGFFWWVGEVEDNEDPMELGRVKVRCLGYYTNFAGGTTADLPTEYLPWATVLQHTSQAGNDGQGESAGQLQPGAIVIGFFLDGENAQMPMVLGVMRINKSERTQQNRKYSFTNKEPITGTVINSSDIHPAENDNLSPDKINRQSTNNTVAIPGQVKTVSGGHGSPKNIGVDLPGGTSNPIKPIDPELPIPAASGIGGPWKTIEYKLSYLIEDLANTTNTLVKVENDNYLDMISGRMIMKTDLLKPIEDYVTTIYAQVISAMRQSLIVLSKDIELATLLRDSNSEPFMVRISLQAAITKVLNSACALDSSLNTYVKESLSTVTSNVDTYLTGVLSKSDLVKLGVDDLVKDIIETIKNMLLGIGDVTKSIKDTVDGLDTADLIDTWEKSTGIFDTKTTLFGRGQYTLTDVFKLLASPGDGCKRGFSGAEKTAGWYPLYGLNRSTIEELESVNKLRGNVKDGTDLYSSLFRDADPYTTVAKNHVNGSYDLYLGTPGRRGEIHKKANGTTHTSVLLNNAHYAEKVARDAYKKENPDATQAEIDAAAEAYKKSQTDGKGDTGALVADHISYAGNLTQEVHGDDCKLVSKNNALVVDGDYFLKITGDCHIEVGGGFFFSAEGSPKYGGSIQKHSLKFGSDVDMNVVGAKFNLQGAECDLAAVRTRITSSFYENASDVQTMSGLEVSIAAESSIQMVTPHLLQLINVEEESSQKKITGIRTVVVGGYETYVNPTNAKDYRIVLTGAKTLYNEPITSGLYQVKTGSTINISHNA